jgi:MFS superfamily sulfate permease-like transporter
MTLNDAFEGQSLKSTQIVQKGSLIVLAVAASLVLAFSHRNGIMLGVVLAICTVAAPAVWMLTRRMLEKVRQRETEDRLLMHTRTYLQQEEPVVVAAKPAAVESDIEILARAIDGSKLPTEDFRMSYGVALMLPVGEPVVFDALPRRYAIRGLYERRFADLSATLPKPAFLPLSELLPGAATQAFGDWTAKPRHRILQRGAG